MCVRERVCENGARNVYISTCGNVGYNGIQEDEGGRMREGLEKLEGKRRLREKTRIEFVRMKMQNIFY